MVQVRKRERLVRREICIVVECVSEGIISQRLGDALVWEAGWIAIRAIGGGWVPVDEAFKGVVDRKL